jgi:hypothetical protein
MSIPHTWRKEKGARIEGHRDLDLWKVQAPCIVPAPDGRYRLFYTGIGPAKPFADCQGYILSAVSDDGLSFVAEPGIRLQPDSATRHMSLRVLAPSVARINAGWRMYFEARGPADLPTSICSAVSPDLLDWTLEPGMRLSSAGGVGAPRYVSLPDGRGRLYCVESRYDAAGPGRGRRLSTPVVSAITRDGLTFMREPGIRLRDRESDLDSAGITAAEPVPGEPWVMYFSAWQDVPAGTVVPPHPSADPTARMSGSSANFAAASIAADMAGYRSRIFTVRSSNGLDWVRDGLVIEGDGYGGIDLDAVHAEDMSLIKLPDGRWRMYYAACDTHGVWRIVSAISD